MNIHDIEHPPEPVESRSDTDPHPVGLAGDLPLSLRVDLDPRINYAMQQNDVPIIKALHLENRGDEPLRELGIRITADPEFAATWTAHIALVGERATYNVEAVDLVLSPRYLGALTERVAGLLWFEVTQEDRVWLRRSQPVELLARDEWSGLGSLPEILAAFVLPNHPAVEGLLSEAARILEGWTGDPSLSGYQSKDPRRVGATAAAIYAVLQQRGISYINPPASFEAQGQRIRLPDRILESKMATCLDLAVLAAACLEQAGLNALVVFVKGHAITGVWLQEDCFGEPVSDDPLRLRKRVDLGEICLFDPTWVTARPPVGFEQAMQEARRQLDRTEEFLCVIDLRRARKGRIRPLPERIERPEEAAFAPEAPAAVGTPAAPDLDRLGLAPQPEGAPPAEQAETPAIRLDRWRRKLLDLSLRNRLLNFRDTKRAIPLLCPDLPALETTLAEGTLFRLRPRPADFGSSDPRDPNAHQRRTGAPAVEELLREELKARRLYADLAPEELDRRLIEIYRAARLELEEGGASALYLALGFLAWYESPTSPQQRLAPILMLPLELHRNSVREGFQLRLGDEDPRVNVTLLELLAQDYGLRISGLDPLPETETGLDVAGILRTFRQAIRDIDRWDVLDTARLGLFSFTKFLMWRDLTGRTADLMRNPVVEHLVSRPNQAFDEGAAFPHPDRLDQERPPARTFCPLSADSSQLAAVFAAAEGRSFVLEGPPGTGKSQTITNLIAHCLSEGKSVLFVSEKMAALNVVHSRLERVGLGRYCLELHSNKAHKREVIAQFEEALRRFEARPQEAWAREARRLEGLRNELNAYVQALHQQRSTGETVFQAISRLIGLRAVRRVELHWPSPDALDADQLAGLRDLVSQLATAGAACGEVPGHAWEAVQHADWTPGWEDEVRRDVAQFEETVHTLEERAKEVSHHLFAGEGKWSLERLALLDELSGVLLESPAPPTALLVQPDWEEIQAQIGTWIVHGRRRDALRAELYPRYREKLLDLDLDELAGRLERANHSWPPASWLHRRRVRKALQRVSQDGKAPPPAELGPTLERARQLRDEEGELAAAGDQARTLLGRYWQEGEAAWEGLEEIRGWAHRFRGLALRAAGDNLKRVASLRERWARLATEGRELLGREGPVGRALVAFRQAYDLFCQARQTVEERLQLDAGRAWGRPEAPDVLKQMRATLRGWREQAHALRPWCAWRRTRAEALRADLAPLVEAYERGELRSSDLGRVFERSYSQWWLSAVTSAEPALSRFFSPEHERKIVQFREADERFTRLTQDLIAGRLAERAPTAGSSVSANSEMGILQREIAKKRRHMPMRSLFQRIPNLLPRLKPCLLMSPMSVAQYLDPGYSPFDLIVFDEASQIPVWDAIGAIARGKQAVIVGDPKQLPPTTFFQRMEEEEEVEDPEQVEDLESILDECIGARIPCLQLNWHYRSRHESLIAFSNYHYYGNRLLTFPSPLMEGMGVAWRHVPTGVYDKGKSRTNRAEAEAVVAEIVRRLKDPELARRSLGVVTFNQSQQMLIEDLLEEARRNDPEVDAFFGEEVPEPVFVKNLESVQGDERDVILFSICYGPDAQGRISMNFGPMNREGGERRLNVAITRARREVLVFSTLQADQIDLARTRARGVQDLKSFLEYAQRGPSAIAEATQYFPDEELDSPFEQAVHDALVERGWQLHRQVGCSGYRIDLAVIDPAAPGRYLLGIECDGANYHRAKTARDRDRLREAILRDLGWELHRIWSTDWWATPDQELRKLEAALGRARQARRAQGSQPGPGGRAEPEAGQHAASVPAPPPRSPEPRKRSAAASQPEPLPPYQPVKVDPPCGSPQGFYGTRANRQIREKIAQVVAQEGPIRLELAARRVASFWGFQRAGSQVVQRIRELAPQDHVSLKETPDGVCLWPADREPNDYTGFRVPGPDPDSFRSPEELPLEEVANAALHLLRQQISLPLGDLARETGRLFGFPRAGRAALARMRQGAELLVERGWAGVEGPMITLARRSEP